MNSTYFVRVKSCPRWREFDTARLSISVGKDYHEGEKFAAAVDWIGGKFKHCIVMVSDTLQRHTIQLSAACGEEEALVLSKKQGDDWLNRNKAVLATLSIPYVIQRWNDWLSHSDFPGLHQEFEGLLVRNPAFQEKVVIDIGRFISRQRKLGTLAVDEPRAFHLCRSFLLEEMAVHTLMGRHARAAKIYPSSDVECLGAIRRGEVEGAPKGLEQEYRVHISLLHRGAATKEEHRQRVA